MSDIELKPCPFCGARAIFGSSGEFTGSTLAKQYVRCSENCQPISRDIDKVINAWNTRPQSRQTEWHISMKSENGGLITISTREYEYLLNNKSQGWQDIESAPKDGTPVLLNYNSGVIVGLYCDWWQDKCGEAWRVKWDMEPLSDDPDGWLPAPPTTSSEDI